MKKLVASLLMMLLLCLTPAFAQNSPLATSTSPAVLDKSKVISRLLIEVDDARAYVATLEARVAALEAQTEADEAARLTLTQSYRDALLELGETRATIKELRAAIEESEIQKNELRAARDAARTERDDAARKAKSLRRENTILKLLMVAREVIPLFLRR